MVERGAGKGLTGLTLIELLVALAIFSLVIGSMLEIIAFNFHNVQLDISKANCLSIAKEVMELYLSYPSSSISDGEKVMRRQIGNLTYWITVKVQPENRAEFNGLNLRDVEVEVYGGFLPRGREVKLKSFI